MSDVDWLRNYARITDVTTTAGNTPHMRTWPLACMIKRNFFFFFLISKTLLHISRLHIYIYTKKHNYSLCTFTKI
jgi:hypothetical protein